MPQEFTQEISLLTSIEEDLIETPIYYYKFVDPSYYETLEPIKRIWRAYKKTPKGYWFVPDYDVHYNLVDLARKKWLANEYRPHTTRFAFPNEEDALYSYYRRKLEHLRHLENKHKHIKAIIKKIEKEHNIFGRQRPLITNILHPYPKLNPLKRKRITSEFIEEIEMEI